MKNLIKRILFYFIFIFPIITVWIGIYLHENIIFLMPNYLKDQYYQGIFYQIKMHFMDTHWGLGYLITVIIIEIFLIIMFYKLKTGE